MSVSTVLGTALAGFARVGLDGAIGMLFGVWITSIGLFLLWSGFRSQNQRPITLLGGAATTILGLIFVGSIATANYQFDGIGWPSLHFNRFVVLLIVGLCYVVWDVLRIKWQMSFDVTQQGLSNVHGIPEQKLALIREFFLKMELERSTKLTVRASRDKNGYLTIKCYGDFQRDEQQRIRNFLSDML